MKKLLFLCFFIYGFAFSQKKVNDTIIVAYTPAAPFIIQQEDNLSGINIWLWNRVANDLNMPFKLVQMDFQQMLEALENETIDVSINPLTITNLRSKKMEFTHSFFASNSTIAVRTKSSFSKFLEFLDSFFNINSLRGIFALFLLISIFALLIWVFEKKRNPHHFRKGWKGFFDGMWWSIVTMTTVGYGDKYPISRGGKIVALIWMFSGLLFISGLTASIASNLTVSTLSAENEDFNEYKDRAVGSIANSSSTQFLKDHFFNNIQEFGSVKEGLQNLSNQHIDAFLYDEPILKYNLKQSKTFENIRLLPVKFDLQLYAFALPKRNAALEQLISQKILELTESHEWRVVLNEYGLNEL